MCVCECMSACVRESVSECTHARSQKLAKVMNWNIKIVFVQYNNTSDIQSCTCNLTIIKDDTK